MDYKDHLTSDSALVDDELFKVKLDTDEYTATLIDAPTRAGFKLVNLAYGFTLSGFGGEVEIAIFWVARQDGNSHLHGVHVMCDDVIVHKSHTVKWDDEEAAINHMLNELYFERGK